MCLMYSWSHTLKTLWYEVRQWSHMGLTPDCFQYWFLNLPFLNFSYDNLKIVWYIRNTRFLFFSVHSLHGLSIILTVIHALVAVKMAFQNWIPSPLQMKKRPKGSMKHSWKNVPTIPISYPYCLVYRNKNECYKQSSMKNRAPDNWSHKWKN